MRQQGLPCYYVAANDTKGKGRTVFTGDHEHFTLEGFIRANCEYPGQWDGEVEQVITTDTHVVTATHVYNKDGSMSCHVASFIRVVDGKIASMDEYWGDDGPAPQWRQEKHIGSNIRE